MRYRAYLKDWYYNAGIIGFLNVLSEGMKNINEITNKYDGRIIIEENYIEFEHIILDGFYEKYKKLAFDIFFDIDNYKERTSNLVNKIQSPNTRITKELLQNTALNGKTVNKFVKEIYGKDFNNIFAENRKDKNNLLVELHNTYEKLNQYQSNIEVYNHLVSIKSNFIDYFLDNELTKRISAYKNIKNYLNKISDKSILPKNNNHKCYICETYKKEYDFSNAITQVSGFNSDNSNWIWGFQPSKVKICSLCALIYSCAVHGMVFINRKIDKNYKTFFYALNRNTDISTLYHSFWIFKEKIIQKKNQNKPFYTILQEVTVELIQQHSRAVLENINFIEIEENKFGGRSTRGYNIYNYNITKELAEFIKTMGNNGIPKGFYRDRDLYSDITEEILKKTLEHTLGFFDLSRYVEYFIRSYEPKSKVSVQYSISKVSNYILKYINKIKGGDAMAQEQIVNKAFYNGKFLGEKIGQENKIKGFAYQLLNDLKIGDRNSFMDKYLRLRMAYGIEVKLGSNNELTDIDNFMSFGYAFVNGLLSNLKSQNTEEVQND